MIYEGLLSNWNPKKIGQGFQPLPYETSNENGLIIRQSHSIARLIISISHPSPVFIEDLNQSIVFIVDINSAYPLVNSEVTITIIEYICRRTIRNNNTDAGLVCRKLRWNIPSVSADIPCET